MVANVTAAEASQLIENGIVEVIDVRAADEWASGHIEGARLIPLDQLRANPGASLTRDAVIFVCAGGVRSETAARIASQYGLRTIYSLRGGTQSWSRAGFPLTSELRAAV